MKRIKGECKDCRWFAQEPVELDGEIVVLDKYCRLYEMFKRPDGYCDNWEHDWQEGQ